MFFITLYLFIFKRLIDIKIYNNNLININLAIKNLHECTISLLNDIFNDAKANFRNYINTIQMDKGEEKNEINSDDYINGLFSIFKNYNDFCLEIKSINYCYCCHKMTDNKFFIIH